ncbi:MULTISPECIES: bifunctional alpha/beta hydrolase/OsmC family protein [Thiorhodovibrio]|uniref:bifunctional alpha/beta hydrolase/OsmC family protein n=1 Tax=Thiorhodovibrio TaxID=61593 RepID=UPI0019132D33|nr:MULTISPECIES: alpha/beta fold hydrolase [Thiorhodovibrio]MBK5970081.1 osmotically inducible protein C [Thiorhodovibrio winogradskyi]WPL13463.1 exosortase A system-associated hydrolase 2 [Thiorhodovibrio litoralis]
MARIRLEFPNQRGELLAGLLETPSAGTSTLAYALFAHCFTCGKDIAAASRISRALAARGIAVLRFDFTGLGNSDGDFANTSFSSNVADLLAAAEMLGRDYAAPRLLIGHSLGGAAILVAAHRLPKVDALVTIAAPATATHVRHLFSGAESELSARGEAEVRIARRRFRIKKQFLDDLEQHATPEHIGRLRRPLLLFHSPLDAVVAISEAFSIYQAAKHPKSFISLDQADHLLTDPADAVYVADTLVAWASRYLRLPQSPSEPSMGTIPQLATDEVLARELGDSGLLGLYSDHHQLAAAGLPCADDPPHQALAPTPATLLRMALAADLCRWLRGHAAQAGYALDDVEVRVDVPLNLPEADAAKGHVRSRPESRSDPEPEPEPEQEMRCRLRLTGDLSEHQRTILCEEARQAPLALALTQKVALRLQLEED